MWALPVGLGPLPAGFRHHRAGAALHRVLSDVNTVYAWEVAIVTGTTSKRAQTILLIGFGTDSARRNRRWVADEQLDLAGVRSGQVLLNKVPVELREQRPEPECVLVQVRDAGLPARTAERSRCTLGLSTKEAR